MNKKLFALVVVIAMALTWLASCAEPKQEADGAYDFVIYASDGNNNDLSDNPVVASYRIAYTGCKTVTDTLIRKDDDRYYFTESAADYLVLKDSAYGLSYTEGYFANYAGCAGGAIDVSWSMTLVNGTPATCGIGETPLEGLTEFGFVINGWK